MLCTLSRLSRRRAGPERRSWPPRSRPSTTLAASHPLKNGAPKLKPIAAFLTLLLTSGCSLIFVKGPPQVRPGATTPATAICTTTRLIPMVDGLLALAWGISATRFLTDEDVDADVETYLAAYAPPLLMAGSAVEGWRRVTRCNEFMLTPVNSEEAAATYETYFRWRPPMLLPLVQPPLVPRKLSALPVPSRLPAWFKSNR